MKIIPISKENHSDWSYVGLTHYMHTKNDAIVPILIAEIDRITSTNPIVFIENNEKLGLYSLQSLLPNMNLMIDNQGIWTQNYIPARYRSLPFVLATDSNKKNTNEKVLCYVEDLNCVAKSVDKKSTKIFNSNEDLSEDMKRVFEFLKSIEQNELVTQKALLAIKEANIIEDWSLSIKLSDGERTMKGLKKINIEKFKSLPGNILENLNTTGGLDICFSNILSLNNIENLRQILISKTQSIQKNKEISENKSLRDLTLEKQSKEKKEEMDNLVKDLLLED